MQICQRIVNISQSNFEKSAISANSCFQTEASQSYASLDCLHVSSVVLYGDFMRQFERALPIGGWLDVPAVTVILIGLRKEGPGLSYAIGVTS